MDAENTLILELESGPVTITLRPDLAPKHVERIKALAISRLSPTQLADLAYFEKPESVASEASVRDGTSKDDPWTAVNIVLWLGWLNTAGWAVYAIWLWVQRWRGARSK